MGVLGNQPRRNYFSLDSEKLDIFISDALKISKKYEVSIESVINARQILELERQNNIAVQNGDYIDEQVGGFGEILKQIAFAIEQLK